MIDNTHLYPTRSLYEPLLNIIFPFAENLFVIDNHAFVLYYYAMENIKYTKKESPDLQYCLVQTKYPELERMIHAILDDRFVFSNDGIAPVLLIVDGTSDGSDDGNSIVLFSSDKMRSETLLRPFSADDLISAAERVAWQTASSGFSADESRCLALLGDRSVKLTATEFRLYSAILEHGDGYISAKALSEAVWDKYDRNLCTVYISYLRHKLDSAFGDGTLITAHGKGYRLREAKNNIGY